MTLPSAFRFRGQEDVAADEVKQDAEHRERKEREQIRIRAVEERIVRLRPFFDLGAVEREGRHALHDGDDDPGERAARDVARSEQDAGALVALGGQLFWVRSLCWNFSRRSQRSTSQRTMPPMKIGLEEESGR